MSPDKVEDHISAEPTKSFFVDMLVKDIALDQAILDLLDNSVDGAKRSETQTSSGFEEKRIDIHFDANRFVISDNCGGFSKKVAREYAFRFGRAKGATSTPHSIGQFGVGMKRALFKFGKNFRVDSMTAEDSWAVDIDVEAWEVEPGWTFPWSDVEENHFAEVGPGTHIVVSKLRPEVATRFSSPNFQNLMIALIKSKHRQFISEGLDVRVNGTRIDATDLALSFSNELQPGVDIFSKSYGDSEPVKVKIIAGVGV